MSTLDDPSWAERLPTFQGLFADQHSTASASSLLRPFSLFGLFKIASPAKSSPTLPSTSLLQPILQLVGADHTVTIPSIIKALVEIQVYSQQFVDHCKSNAVTHEEDDGEGLGELVKAHLSAFWVISQLPYAPQDELHTAQRQSLEAMFILRSHLVDTAEIDKALLAAPFHLPHENTSSTSPHPNLYLTLLFTHPRHLITTLQTQTRLVHKVKPEITTTATSTISEAEVLHTLSLLDTFLDGIVSFERMRVPGSKEAKTKTQKEEENSRQLRLGIEAELLRCDLALSMGTAEIKGIKSRATMALRKMKEVREEKGDKEDIPEEEEEEDEEERDEEPENDDGAQWECVAEDALIRCLETARTIVEDKLSATLSDRIDRSDWIPESTIAKPLVHKKALPDPDSDEDVDSSSSVSEESEDAEETYPCPLRTIFRLHDRYEEQRLAVWLSLPADRRHGMGTYLRGAGGKVGEAWDGMGVLLLLDYDSDTLMNFGLSGDKLDKWVEIAARKNAKRIRLKGRKCL